MAKQTYICEINQIFNDLTVIDNVKVKGMVLVRCKCGKEFRVYPSRLYSNKIKHCHNCSFYKNLLNTRQHFLYITDQIRRENGKAGFVNILCKCDCGNERWLRPNVIRNMKSCGCLIHQKKNNGDEKIIDRSGITIDKLTVLNDYKIIEGNAHWKVKCICGYEGYKNISKVLSYYKKFNQASCGCSKVKTDVPNARKQYHRYKFSAKKRNYSFELSFEDFTYLTQENCFYCGSRPSNEGTKVKRKYDTDTFVYNGIDRVNNNEGYILENCVPCCARCNAMKMDMTLEDFKNHIMKIILHLK